MEQLCKDFWAICSKMMIEKDWAFSSFRKRFLHCWWAVMLNKVQRWTYQWQGQILCIYEIITEALEKVWAAAESQIDLEAIQEVLYIEPISVQIIPLFLSPADTILNWEGEWEAKGKIMKNSIECIKFTIRLMADNILVKRKET